MNAISISGSGHRSAGLAALVALACMALAGCSSPEPTPANVDASGNPCGDVQGVVVDQAIRPVDDATVELTGGGEERKAVTGSDGAFRFECLLPGTYLVRASQPLFDEVQQSTEVGADGSSANLKLQLQRVIFATPYNATLKFEGFLVCSIGFFVYASEECGEGVGVPCEVPVLGCQRMGGQDNNRAQFDFYLDGPFVRDLVVDMTWDSASPTLERFYLVLATEWTCDPFCIGNELNITTGADPLYLTQAFVNGTAKANTGNITVDADTRFSTFVWPDWGHGDVTRADVAVNQGFQVFATAFYYLPAPDGWTFLDDR